MSYINNFKGRANRRERAKHLRDEFLSIEAGFETFLLESNTSLGTMYTNEFISDGVILINPANGYLQELTLIEDSTIIMIADPTGPDSDADSKRVSLLIHGANKRIVNGWGPQTWKDIGVNDWLYLYTGSGEFSSLLIEFYWESTAWIGVVSSKNQTVDDVANADQTTHPFAGDLLDANNTLSLTFTRAGGAPVFDHLGHLIHRALNEPRYEGVRYVHNWVATPSDLTSEAFEETGATTATEVGIGPSGEDVTKITFTTTGGSVGCWFLPNFGRAGEDADTIKVAVRFRAKMFDVADGSFRLTLALMGALNEAIPVHESVTIDIHDNWDDYGYVFDLVTDKDENTFNLNNPQESRVLTHLMFQSPSGSTGDPVLITDAQIEIVREDDLELPQERQDGTIGSSMTLAASVDSTGDWDDGTKIMELDLTEYVDFQDSLEIGKTYLMVARSNSGDTADFVLGRQTFWQAYRSGGLDSKYVKDAAFTFRYEGGAAKWVLTTGIVGEYTVNVYECSGNTGSYRVSQSVALNPDDNNIITAQTPYLSALNAKGLVYEDMAIENLIGVDDYRDFRDWTKVGLTDLPDPEGTITSQRSEYGIDGLPMHGTLIRAAKETELGYMEWVVTIPADSNEYTASIFIRKTYGPTDPSTPILIPQQQDILEKASASQYMGVACLMDSFGGDVLVVDIANSEISSGNDYSRVTLEELFNWFRLKVSLQNDGSYTEFKLRLYPAVDSTGTDATKTGWAIVDWAQLEQEVGDQHGSYPVVGGETRPVEALTTTLSAGWLYDSHLNEVGSVSSGDYLFDTDGVFKNILWSSKQAESDYTARQLHEFGPPLNQPSNTTCTIPLYDENDIDYILDEVGSWLCVEDDNHVVLTSTLLYYFTFEIPLIDPDPAVDTQIVTHMWGDMARLFPNEATEAANNNLVLEKFNVNRPFYTEEGMHGNQCLRFDHNHYQHRLISNRYKNSGSGAFSPTSIADAWETDEYAIVFWFWPDNLSSKQTIFSGGSSDGYNDNKGTNITINTDGTIEWHSGNGTIAEDIVSTAAAGLVVAGQWNMILVNHNKGDKEIGISINGAEVEWQSYTVTLATSRKQFLIGFRNVTGSTTSGMDQYISIGSKLQYLYIFSEIRSRAKIALMWNDGDGVSTQDFMNADSVFSTGESPQKYGLITRLDASDEWAAYENGSTDPYADEVATSDGVTVDSIYPILLPKPNFIANSFGGGVDPVYKTGIQNGKNIVRFAGSSWGGFSCWASNDGVNNANISDIQVFFVGSGTGCFFSTGQSGSNHVAFELAGGKPQFHSYESSYSTPPQTEERTVTGGSGAGSAFGIFSISFKEGTVRLYFNGALITTQTGNSAVHPEEYPINPIYTWSGVIGTRNFNALVNTFNGDFGELQVYRQSMDELQTIEVMDEMNERWAVY